MKENNTSKDSNENKSERNSNNVKSKNILDLESVHSSKVNQLNIDSIVMDEPNKSATYTPTILNSGLHKSELNT